MCGGAAHPLYHFQSERRKQLQTAETVRPDETIEDLQLAGLRLIQKKNGFRFGMDSVLLADFAEIRPTDLAADLGTGNGIIPLLLIGRGKSRHIYGVELMTETAELARRNVCLNGLENRISVIQSDAADAAACIGKCTVDVVICNPPYGHPSASLASGNLQKAAARTQEEDTLHRFFSGAYDILKGKGKLSLVYPAPQMLHVMKCLQEHHLEPKRFRLVYPRADKPANLVLIEALKDAKPTLHPMPPMVIYHHNGVLTDELKSVYHITE